MPISIDIGRMMINMAKVTVLKKMGKINGNIVQHRWVVLNPMDMDCSTWQAMWQSGVKTGTSMTIIRCHQWIIPKAPQRVMKRSHGVAIGIVGIKGYERIIVEVILQM